MYNLDNFKPYLEAKERLSALEEKISLAQAAVNDARERVRELAAAAAEILAEGAEGYSGKSDELKAARADVSGIEQELSILKQGQELAKEKMEEARARALKALRARAREEHRTIVQEGLKGAQALILAKEAEQKFLEKVRPLGDNFLPLMGPALGLREGELKAYEQRLKGLNYFPGGGGE